MPAFLKIMIYLMIAVLLLWAYVKFIEGTTLFIPSSKVIPFPQDKGMTCEDVYFQTQDQLTLNGWLVRAVEYPEKAATVLFFHGNAGNIGDRFDRIALFHKMEVNVFIIDYRGYGKSQGEPAEQGVYKDALAAYEYLKTRQDIDGDKIVAFGVSLGGAVAVDLASKRKVAALIVESTFSSAVDMGRKILPLIPPVFLSVKFDSLSKIQRVAVPKLFIHSRDDEMISFSLGEKLFDAADEPKEFLEIVGDHNEGYFESRKVYFEKVRLFLKKNGLL